MATVPQQLLAEQRRVTVAQEVLVNRRPVTEVAQQLGVTRTTLYRDLAVIRRDYKRQITDKLDDVRARELHELAVMSREAWSQYHAHCGKNHSVALKWQQQLLAVQQRRASLLGLDADTRSKIGVRTDGETTEVAIVLD